MQHTDLETILENQAWDDDFYAAMIEKANELTHEEQN